MGMRTRRSVTVVALAVLTAVPAGSPAAQDSGAEVRATVEAFEAAWKAGDVESLRALTAPQGVVLWISGEGPEATVDSMTFETLLDSRRPQEVYELEGILSLNVVDDRMADVDVEIRSQNGRYRDHCVLYHVPQGWRIVTKTFVYFPDE
jgi:hypothetical protein